MEPEAQQLSDRERFLALSPKEQMALIAQTEERNRDARMTVALLVLHALSSSSLDRY